MDLYSLIEELRVLAIPFLGRVGPLLLPGIRCRNERMEQDELVVFRLLSTSGPQAAHFIPSPELTRAIVIESFATVEIDRWSRISQVGQLFRRHLNI